MKLADLDVTEIVMWAIAALAVLFALVLPILAHGQGQSTGLEAREVDINCDEKTMQCTLSVDDVAYMVRRDMVQTAILNAMAEKLRACRFKDA